jgi:hypothetical protein
LDLLRLKWKKLVQRYGVNLINTTKGASEMRANTLGIGPRRNFNSKKHWEESSKAAFLSELNELYKKHGAEVSIEINGNASASIEVTLGEYVIIGDDDRYFYQTFDFPKSSK